MEMWRWITIAISVVVGSIGAWWEFKQMYRKNIDSILQSLEELRRLRRELIFLLRIYLIIFVEATLGDENIYADRGME
jgi:hypothetical protein